MSFDQLWFDILPTFFKEHTRTTCFSGTLINVKTECGAWPKDKSPSDSKSRVIPSGCAFIRHSSSTWLRPMMTTWQNSLISWNTRSCLEKYDKWRLFLIFKFVQIDILSYGHFEFAVLPEICQRHVAWFQFQSRK